MVDCLDTLGSSLLTQARREPGPTHTVVRGGHERSLQQSVVALADGQSMSCDRAVCEATLVVLRGAVELRGADRSWDAGEGDLVDLPGERWHATACTDSVVLVTWLETSGA